MRFIEPQGIFKLEPREALEKVKQALLVCEKVRTTFSNLRAQVNKESGKPWEFETDLVFARFNLYEERLKMLLEIFQTADDFAKLEKVELSVEKVCVHSFLPSIVHLCYINVCMYVCLFVCL